jgi:phosphoglycolate phosphatase
MPTISINKRLFDIDLIVFDKDGTLIDLHFLWGARTRHCADWLCQQLELPKLRPALYQTLGYEPGSGLILANSPMATIPRRQLVLVTATVLYQQGIGWHQAHKLAEQAFQETMTIAPKRDDLKPCAELRGLFERLHSAGVQIAVATSDDRRPTEATLDLLALRPYIAASVCGDDALPSKPAAEVIQFLAQHCQVKPERIMMVGDSDCDMQTGLNAGVSGCLGVLSGACDAEVLGQYTDLIAESIAVIEVV